jgi:hypothetical protein
MASRPCIRLATETQFISIVERYVHIHGLSNTDARSLLKRCACAIAHGYLDQSSADPEQDLLGLIEELAVDSAREGQEPIPPYSWNAQAGALFGKHANIFHQHSSGSRDSP